MLEIGKIVGLVQDTVDIGDVAVAVVAVDIVGVAAVVVDVVAVDVVGVDIVAVDFVVVKALFVEFVVVAKFDVAAEDRFVAFVRIKRLQFQRLCSGINLRPIRGL